MALTRAGVGVWTPIPFPSRELGVLGYAVFTPGPCWFLPDKDPSQLLEILLTPDIVKAHPGGTGQHFPLC